MPNAAKKTRPIEATAAENRGSRNSLTSSDGWSLRRSYQTNAARIASPARMAAHDADRSKPCSPPSMMP